MPFDAIDYSVFTGDDLLKLGFAPSEPYQVNLPLNFRPQPRLSDLAALLREKKRWPHGFKWDYQDECSCAVGLFMRHWFNRWPYNSSRDNIKLLSALFSIDEWSVKWLFYAPGRFPAKAVSMKIEAYLAQKEDGDVLVWEQEEV